MSNRFFKTLLATAGLCAFALAQAPAPVARIHVPPVTRIAVNSTALARLTVAIQPGFHIQSNHPKSEFLIPTRLRLAPAGGVDIVHITWPQPSSHKFTFSPDPLDVFEGTVPVVVHLRERGLRTGARLLKGTFRYQACNDQLCRPPVTVPVTLRVDVVPAHHR